MKLQLKQELGNRLKETSYLDIFIWSILGAVLLVALAFGFPQVVGAEEALIVQSGSMEPTIPTGSVIWISDTNGENLEEGDIITYGPEGGTPEDEYTTHRIIEVRGSGSDVEYVTKGDNNEDPDPGTVTPERIEGVHMFTVAQLGYAVVEGRKSSVFLILIGVASALIILGELRTLYTEYREMKEEDESRDIVQTFAVAFSLLVLAIAAIRFTSYPTKLMEMAGFSVSVDLLTGIAIMAAMLVSVIVLRFI